MPVFVDGQAQVVDAFSDSSRWVRDVLWVETEFDSDGDGSRDRMHVDVTRPAGSRTFPTRAHMRRKGTRGSLSGFDINLRHQPSTSIFDIMAKTTLARITCCRDPAVGYARGAGHTGTKPRPSVVPTGSDEETQGST